MDWKYDKSIPSKFILNQTKLLKGLSKYLSDDEIKFLANKIKLGRNITN